MNERLTLYEILKGTMGEAGFTTASRFFFKTQIEAERFVKVLLEHNATYKSTSFTCPNCISAYKHFKKDNFIILKETQLVVGS